MEGVGRSDYRLMFSVLNWSFLVTAVPETRRTGIRVPQLYTQSRYLGLEQRSRELMTGH